MTGKRDTFPSPEVKRDRRVTILLTEKEFAKFAEHAKKNDMTMSELIRCLCAYIWA
jgi:hypothetical protein